MDQVAETVVSPSPPTLEWCGEEKVHWKTKMRSERRQRKLKQKLQKLEAQVAGSRAWIEQLERALDETPPVTEQTPNEQHVFEAAIDWETLPLPAPPNWKRGAAPRAY